MGGSSGIGRATAIKFAEQGADVVIAARRSTEGEAVAQEIRDSGGGAMFVKADVTQAEQVEAAVEQTVSTFGSLDMAFNNAGLLAALGPPHEIEEDAWDREIDVNLKGVWLCLKYEIRQMLAQGGGSIVNDSSAGGLKGASKADPYSAAKHGVTGLTKSAALEYAPHGIRVNAVCPGSVETPMTKPMYDDPDLKSRIISAHPIGRVGNPKEFAEAVTWLCSDSASFVTGIAMPVDGGYIAK